MGDFSHTVHIVMGVYGRECEELNADVLVRDNGVFWAIPDLSV